VHMRKNSLISAIILAAGESKRMHQSKIVLPWGSGTVISHIISILKSAEIDDIVVVTGGYQELVEKEVEKAGGRSVYNPDYQNDEMVISLKIGLNSIIDLKISGFFLVLGDQPTIIPEDLRGMIQVHKNDPGKIVIPSYSMHRGHPWLVPNKYFNEIAQLKSTDTLRTFLQINEKDIAYYIVDHSEVMVDIDTPEDYKRLLPE
jgi:molybdenum cofactor cytidylyltransferase